MSDFDDAARRTVAAVRYRLRDAGCHYEDEAVAALLADRDRLLGERDEARGKLQRLQRLEEHYRFHLKAARKKAGAVRRAACEFMQAQRMELYAIRSCRPVVAPGWLAAEVETLRRERDAAREVLAAVQWEGYVDGCGACPACRNQPHHGHEPDCALAKAAGITPPAAEPAEGAKGQSERACKSG